jgi:hypothetical protein
MNKFKLSLAGAISSIAVFWALKYGLNGFNIGSIFGLNRQEFLIAFLVVTLPPIIFLYFRNKTRNPNQS